MLGMDHNNGHNILETHVMARRRGSLVQHCTKSESQMGRK